MLPRRADGQTDGWQYGWIDIQMDVHTNLWAVKRPDRQMDGRTDCRTKTQLERRKDTRMRQNKELSNKQCKKINTLCLC